MPTAIFVIVNVSGTHHHGLIERGDAGVPKPGHHLRLTVQVPPRVLLLYARQVDYLDGHLQNTSRIKLMGISASACDVARLVE